MNKKGRRKKGGEKREEKKKDALPGIEPRTMQFTSNVKKYCHVVIYMWMHTQKSYIFSTMIPQKYVMTT